MKITPFFHQSIHTIAPDKWRDAAGGLQPFLDYNFLQGLEQSASTNARTGWQPYHLELKITDSPSAFMPLYLKSHSYGEYVFDFKWAEAYERSNRPYYPKLQSAIPFTPVTGPRLLIPDCYTDKEQALLVQASAQALKSFCNDQQISSVHINFLTEAQAALYEAEGFLRREDQQFHWYNQGYSHFEDFLNALNARKRKQIRKERAQVAAENLSIKQLQGDAISDAAMDVFFAFYLDTSARKWGQAYLNRAFFSDTLETMRDQMLLILAEKDGLPIAGALNFIGSDCLYGRYWGTTQAYPFLHFELCYYQAIDFAIAHQLSRVEAGAQGIHKLARGYLPHKTHSVHWINEPDFRQAIAHYLKLERAQVDAENKTIHSDYSPYKKSEPTQGF